MIKNLNGKIPMKKGKRKSRLRPTEYDILTKEECNRLINVCERSEHPIQNSFIVQTMMIPGLRIGEAAHMKKNWVDFNNKRIRIPSHQPCSCSYCQVRTKQKLKLLHKENWKNVSNEEVMKWYWQPKTVAGVRNVYFGFDPDFTESVNDFFAKNDEWSYSVNHTRRRIKKMFELAGLENHIPHDLRKTAATNFAANNISIFPLMQIMGWDDIQIALRYVRLSGILGERALKKEMGDGKEKLFIHDSRIIFFITNFGRQVITRKKNRYEEEWLQSILSTKKDHIQKNKQLTLHESIP